MFFFSKLHFLWLSYYNSSTIWNPNQPFLINFIDELLKLYLDGLQALVRVVAVITAAGPRSLPYHSLQILPNVTVYCSLITIFTFTVYHFITVHFHLDVNVTFDGDVILDGDVIFDGVRPEVCVRRQVFPEGVPPRVLAAAVVVPGDLFRGSVRLVFEVELEINSCFIGKNVFRYICEFLLVV